MKKSKKESFFWTSYSDLMTSLFFVMLVLFVLVVALLHKKIKEQQGTIEEYETLEKIRESFDNIDSTYFTYNPEYKKHILNIKVHFPKGKYEMQHVDGDTQKRLRNAGMAIKNQIDKITKIYSDTQYLLIIEGQASRDNFAANYELSYLRALELKRFWEKSGIDFGNNCEVLIAGSGTGGNMREAHEELNQRFLIHIIPKTGKIDMNKKGE